MPGNLSANRVVGGRLAGFTKAEVEALWLRYKEDPFAESISSFSLNGQQMSFGAGLSSADKSRIIRDALAQVDPGNWAAPGLTMSVRF